MARALLDRLADDVALMFATPLSSGEAWSLDFTVTREWIESTRIGGLSRATLRVLTDSLSDVADDTAGGGIRPLVASVRVTAMRQTVPTGHHAGERDALKAEFNAFGEEVYRRLMGQSFEYPETGHYAAFSGIEVVGEVFSLEAGDVSYTDLLANYFVTLSALR